MNKNQKKEFLKSLMVKQYEEMKNSEFTCDKDYSVQLTSMFSVAAGAAPELPVGDVWKMAREVIKT